MEAFFGYYSADIYEKFMIWNRMTGPYAPFYWCLILCNIITPQFLWFKRIRTNPLILWCISIVVNIGMWLERFVIVITSLHRDFLPSSWGMYWPTDLGLGVFIGHARFLHDLHLPVRPRAADDYDLRTAHASAGGAG